MSLIINTLNKVKNEENKKYVPPHLVIERKNQKFKSIRIFSLLGILLILVAVSLYFFIFSEKKQNYSVKSVVKTENNKNLQDYGLILEENKPIVKEEKLSKPKLTRAKETKKINNLPKKKNNVKKDKKTTIETNLKKTKATNFEIITPEKREYIFNKYLLTADKYYLKGQNKKAIEFYEKALYLKSDISVLNVLLHLYIQEGKVNQVVKVLKSLKISSENEDMVSGLIIEMIDSGYKKEANQILSELINKDKTGYLLYSKGYLEEKNNNLKEALSFYQKAYEKNKKDPFISYSYGKLEEKNKNYEKALKIYKDIIEKNPNHRLSKKLEKKLQNIN